MFFKFGPFDEEIKRKEDAMRTPASVYVDEFIRRMGNRLDANDLLEIKELLEKLSKIDLNLHHDNYLIHPIRVAESYLSNIHECKYGDVEFGLCHNIIENSPSSVKDLKLSKTSLEKINLLTIDRSQERNSKYLDSYYSEIFEYSENLLIFKTLDKIDNALWWPSMTVDKYYYTVIEEFIFPRLSTISLRHHQYFKGLLDYIRNQNY
jgi:hypothetical protein